ncbi:MAG: MazG nucleotide pyrophosphohydrolase domain-containing protein [Armatimonadota bacterium]|nr:MazG nucleotide pyrophosphohydrolase domain-containing protein [Armatimonadota bacterium]MDR7427160.1 MazG nucleotide pyrophosphohydrolase domain-containing protein [Armatimonadota bacterium]MDR7463974.1 MazG nucleotide pyrophosphohydrolase domain-containing protein [Armatimonadota bacterium]MDR7470465.1 MazG nucleotide pyrophosphohydrolase domain-containing protein [Armatimonadota bacterium]MDR7473557.1 MazG nucleotide pyrophosphohydrolase domain-containing protein [Armatimonadota bacterium
MDFYQFQQRIATIYGERDRVRGLDGTFRRLVEEVGELARALRRRDPAALEEEVGDVLAWTVSVAALAGVEVARAVARYAAGCPRCGADPCACPGEHPLVLRAGRDG